MSKITLYSSIILLVFLIILGNLYNNSLKELGSKETEIILYKSQIQSLRISLDKQNKLIKSLEVKESKKPKEIETIKNIYVKDTTCNSQLEAYKKLFKELGR